MLKIELNESDRCLLIQVLSGPKTDQDWAPALASFLRLDEIAVRENKSGLAFIIVAPNAERPNANWRRKLAEQRTVYKAKERHLVLITDSILFRGVLNAVNWLSPPPPNEKTFVTASLTEGISQAERWRENQPIPFLRDKFLSI